MTPAQMELARHALGLPTAARRSYRNRYFASAGGATYDLWMQMVAAGEAVRGEVQARTQRSGSIYFELTRQGAEAALLPGETLCPEDFPPEIQS
jgi:hypothetical protein